MQFERKDSYGIADLLEIVRILRAPGGCPWDAEQTHASIRTSLLEETYEVADAIDQQDGDLLREELGDLLLQVVMHAQMETETGAFSFDDVCDGICKKLIYRHPHVFKAAEELSSGQVLENWEKLKNREKGRQTAKDRLSSVPHSLPALMRSAKVQKRAADFGFGYEDTGAAFADLASEVEELADAIRTGGDTRAELGDVLFAAVNVSRFVGADAEEALTEATGRFEGRVVAVEQMAAQQGCELQALDAQTRDAFWKKAKLAEKAE